MEGEAHFQFRRVPRPGCCPVKHCRRASRSGGAKLPIHRLCNTHMNRMWRMQNPEKCAYNRLKYHAQERGIEFEITFEQFLTVTGMQEYVDGRGKRKHMLTLDRVEVTRGYVADNIQVLTNAENRAKQTEEYRRQRVAEKVAGEADPF